MTCSDSVVIKLPQLTNFKDMNPEKIQKFCIAKKNVSSSKKYGHQFLTGLLD